MATQGLGGNVKASAPYMSVGKTFTLVSGEDLSAQQFTAVKVNSSGRVVKCTAATDRAIGILLNDPNLADMEAVIGCFGIYPVRAGAAFVEGDRLAADADGELVATTNANDWTLGLALGEAGAADEIVSALIGPFGNL